MLAWILICRYNILLVKALFFFSPCAIYSFHMQCEDVSTWIGDVQ